MREKLDQSAEVMRVVEATWGRRGKEILPTILLTEVRTSELYLVEIC